MDRSLVLHRIDIVVASKTVVVTDPFDGKGRAGARHQQEHPKDQERKIFFHRIWFIASDGERVLPHASMKDVRFYATSPV